MTKNELKAVYFTFYNELPEPYCTQAKENWDFDFTRGDIPIDRVAAVNRGFNWSITLEGYTYWYQAFGKISELEQTPPLEQALAQAEASMKELKTALEAVRKAIGNESN